MPTPNFPSRDEVLRLHADQIATFGGTAGVRDQGLLDSALAQPQATFGGELLHPTLADQAAAYLYHLSRNHPFIDGNKRTAFAVMDAFIAVNGYRLTLTDDEAYELTMQVAQGANGENRAGPAVGGGDRPTVIAPAARGDRVFSGGCHRLWGSTERSRLGSG